VGQPPWAGLSQSVLGGTSFFFSCAKAHQTTVLSLPLMGSQQPSDGLFSPMEVRTNHLPMCIGPTGTCPSGMVLHIKNFTLLTAGFSTEVNSFHEDYLCRRQQMVLLGVFKHQHLKFCKRDIRTPARVHNVIMSAWIIVRSGTLDVDIRGVPFIEGFFISGG
jgi:hypothetical protein